MTHVRLRLVFVDLVHCQSKPCLSAEFVVVFYGQANKHVLAHAHNMQILLMAHSTQHGDAKDMM
jgi:hypothetical protein